MACLSPLDGLALLSLALVCGSFYVLRRSPGRFLAACAAAIGVFAFVGWRWLDHGAGADRWVALPGLVLASFGLLMVRVMLARSVSLRLLSAYAEGQADPGISTDVARRIEDALHYRLITGCDDRYRLTSFGRGVAWIVAGLYRVQTLR